MTEDSREALTSKPDLKFTKSELTAEVKAGNIAYKEAHEVYKTQRPMQFTC